MQAGDTHESICVRSRTLRILFSPIVYDPAQVRQIQKKKKGDVPFHQRYPPESLSLAENNSP